MSSLTLDEAIEHCREKTDCTECGKQHLQLAEWLEELKQIRDRQLFFHFHLFNIGDTVYFPSLFLNGIRHGTISRIIIDKENVTYDIRCEHEPSSVKKSEKNIYPTKFEAQRELERRRGVTND